MMEFDQTLDDPLRSLQPPINEQSSQHKVKRPLNAYNLFYLERQPKLREAKTFLNGNEISKLVAAEWKGMTPEEKNPWKEKASGIMKKFREENPNYHYDKKILKKRLMNRPNFYDSQLEGQPELINMLMQLGAMALSQFVMSREDVQTDLFRALENGKIVSDFQQQNVPQFDQTSHFEPLPSEIE